MWKWRTLARLPIAHDLMKPDPSIWVLENPEDPGIKSIKIVAWVEKRVGNKPPRGVINYSPGTWQVLEYHPTNSDYHIRVTRIDEDYVWKDERSGYYYSIEVDGGDEVRNDSGKIVDPSFGDDYTTFSFITKGKKVTFVREDITSGPSYNPSGWFLKLKY